MQHLNDDELRALLQQWQAPNAPAFLEKKVLAAAQPARAGQWLKWLMSGSIRIPVPLGLGFAIVLLLLAIQALRPPRIIRPGFDGFQPVRELKPRIIRSGHETK